MNGIANCKGLQIIRFGSDYGDIDGFVIAQCHLGTTIYSFEKNRVGTGTDMAARGLPGEERAYGRDAAIARKIGGRWDLEA